MTFHVILQWHFYSWPLNGSCSVVVLVYIALTWFFWEKSMEILQTIQLEDIGLASCCGAVGRCTGSGPWELDHLGLGGLTLGRDTTIFRSFLCFSLTLTHQTSLDWCYFWNLPVETPRVGPLTRATSWHHMFLSVFGTKTTCFKLSGS